MSSFVQVFVALLSILVSAISASSSVSATFDNAVHYQFDTDGNAIDLTSGKVDWLGGAYVWYGLPFGCSLEYCGVATYSSADLETWHYNGLLFDPDTPEIQTLCGGFLSGWCGRPHLVYSPANNDYVLWVNANSPGYPIFTSNNFTSGFVRNSNRALLGFQPPGPYQAGDFSVQVINGTGYVVYSLLDFTTTGASIWPPFNQSLYVQQLTSDMRNTTGLAYHVLRNSDLVDYQAESPGIFKRGEYFYITASNTCGFCSGTLLIVYRSKTLTGPWKRDIISDDTCGGQTTGVLTLPSTDGGRTSYLHLADLYSTAPLIGTRTAAHGHQFQLLSFRPDGSLRDLDCSLDKSVTISAFPLGTNVPDVNTGIAVVATDGSGETGSYFVSCNLPSYQLYQTWKSSKSGILREVGVNLAGNSPTGNTTFTIFRYSNDSNFFTPHYIWETLATFNVKPGDISKALKIVRVRVGKSVAKGDRLGIAIQTASSTPLCTLVRKASTIEGDISKVDRSGNGHTLFANGPGQVSLRGKDGKTPPVKVLVGQEIKWFAVTN